MQTFIYIPFDKWMADSAEDEAKNVTGEMATSQKRIFRSKMDVHATDFERKIRDRYFKAEMQHARDGGNKPINAEAYLLLKDDGFINANEDKKEQMKNAAFKKVWDK